MSRNTITKAKPQRIATKVRVGGQRLGSQKNQV